MAELDKFKRRIIRTVARMLRQEKKPEEEMWKFLKNETKCDCKMLWERMRSLTLKKIKRLLIAEDKIENIIPIARMTLTDWLLFDMVLVHEDIDVIGEDMGDGKELQSMSDLLGLVQVFNIEGKQGEALAQAWTAATMAYNKNGRQSSPMMLQRRWYQLKKLSREKFYCFWFTCRGKPQMLDSYRNVMPSKLHKEIAERYPHIITKLFPDWEKLIEDKFVILPEEIEKNIKSKMPGNPSENDSEDADLVCVEPNIETIELDDANSDTENTEKDNTVNEPCDNNSPLKVTIKIEPEEEIATVDADALVKEKDAKLLESVPDIDDENSNMEVEASTVTVDVNNIEDENASNTEKEKAQNNKDENETKDNITLVQVNSSENIDIDKDNGCVEVDKGLISEQINETIVMPQITNVLGNVSVEEELDNQSMREKEPGQSISVLNASTASYPCEPMDINGETDRSINDKLKSFLDRQKKSQDTESKSVEEMSCNEIVMKSDLNPYLKISDMTFADDGIELVDDGIELDDEEDIIKNIHESDIIADCKNEVDDGENNYNEENAKFDLKLLMQPVVYTTKVDQMTVFRNIEIDNVRGIDIINSALVESKPVIKEKKEEEIHEELSLDKSKDSDNDESENDTSEFDDIPINMRVKLSSSLLQKPRSRSYNPIQLCKNPDFNTRLKRLTVGFLSSTRNRSFLKTLKPLTVDVNKVFESKLINGTMYLIDNIQSGQSKSIVELKADMTEQTTSVVPSAISVQSLIDYLVVDNVSPAEQVTSNTNNNTRTNDVFPERNKVINLPDLDHVRKMNKRLFTAEISPMCIQNPKGKCIPPVQLISSHFQEKDKHLSPATDFRQPQNVDKLMQTHLNVPVLKIGPKKGKPKTVLKNGQLSKSITIEALVNKRINAKHLYGDALLTLDTLNKMLNAMTNNVNLETKTTSAKSKKKIRMQQESKLKNRLEEFEHNLKNQNTDDFEPCLIVSEKASCNNETTPLVDEKTESTTPLPTSRTNDIEEDCCWARHKMNYRKSRRQHECPRICVCCCRHEYLKIKRRPNKQVSENIVNTIESVVQMSRDGKSEKVSITNQNKEFQKPKQSNISIQCDLDQHALSENLTRNAQVIAQSADNSNLSSNITKIDETKTLISMNEGITHIDLSCQETIEKSVGIPKVNVLIAPEKRRRKQAPVKKSMPETSVLSRAIENCIIVKKLVEQSQCMHSKNPQLKEKLIYLNDNQKKKVETESPIFVGSNKILLTDVTIPPNLYSTGRKTVQVHNLTSSVTVPKGIQIILQTNGQLTYAVDPVTHVASETLRNMPALLAAMQKELNLTKPHNSIPRALDMNKEIIDLVDDENPNDARCDDVSSENTNNANKVDNHTDANNSLDHSAQLVTDIGKNCFENSHKSELSGQVNNSDTHTATDNPKVNNEVTSVDLENDKEVLDNTVSTDDIGNNENQQSDNLKPTAEINATSNETSSSFQDNTSESVVINNETKNKINISCSSTMEIGTEDIETNNANTITTTNRSTLLSDLMEMSGISAEDMKSNENPEVPMPYMLPPSQESPTRYLQTAVNGTPVITTSPNKNVKELNSITSFAQLKYACECNGKFFKLDLETGFITTISVCIKKNPNAIKPLIDNVPPKFVIDLTVDQNDARDKEKDIPAFVIPKLTQSLLKRNRNYDINKTAVPLKLYKSVNILGRNRKDNLNKSKATTFCGIPIKKGTGTDKNTRKRKQSLESFDLNSDESYDSVDQYIWSDYALSSLSEEDDSDDEPLAVKAKRMRSIEQSKELSNVSIKENSAEKSITQKIVDIDMEEPVETTDEKNPAKSSEMILDEDCYKINEMNNEKNVSKIVPNINFLSDFQNDASDEDCILGF